MATTLQYKSQRVEKLEPGDIYAPMEVELTDRSTWVKIERGGYNEDGDWELVHVSDDGDSSFIGEPWDFVYLLLTQELPDGELLDEGPEKSPAQH